MSEPFTTKTTKIAPRVYGCRVFNGGKLLLELQVPKNLISSAYRDMFRTLDKLGYNSPMAHASRMRGKNHENLTGYKYIWH